MNDHMKYGTGVIALAFLFVALACLVMAARAGMTATTEESPTDCTIKSGEVRIPGKVLSVYGGVIKQSSGFHLTEPSTSFCVPVLQPEE